MSLTQLTKKGQSFVWTNEADIAFLDLKKAFTSAPILAHVDPQKPFIIEVDAPKFALGSILSHRSDDGELHPMAFHLHKFDTSNINNERHDKGLLVMIDSFARWGYFWKALPIK